MIKSWNSKLNYLIVGFLLILFCCSIMGVAEQRTFDPPYDTKSSWTVEPSPGDDAFGFANKSSGAIVCLANALAGASKGIALQGVRVRLDNPGRVNVYAKISYHGGSNVVGIAGFAGAEVLWGHGDELNKRTIEGGLNLDTFKDRIDMIVDLKNVDVQSYVKSLAMDIYGAYELSQEMEKIGPPKTETVSFSFNGDAGYNTIWVGLRGLATGAITGQGATSLLGQVDYIRVRW